MKKIYSLFAVIILTSVSFAQSNLKTIWGNNQETLIPSKKIPTKGSLKVTGNVIKGRFDPGYAVVTANGVLPSEIASGSTGTKVGLFVSAVYCDTTTKSSFATASYIQTNKFGMNFDPKSIVFDQVNFTPLLTPTDSYYVDTVWVGCFYQKHTAFNDTLMVEVVWGDTLNSAPTNTINPVYGKFSFGAPQNYMGTYYGPVMNSSLLQGNSSFLSAPASNKKTIKYVLTDADSATTNKTGYIPIVLNGLIGQLIPADNIVSAMATFIPGQANIPSGSISYNSSTSTITATVNGMVARLMVQNSPTLAVSGQNWFDDLLQGKNHTIYSNKRERYGIGSNYLPTVRSNPTRAFMVDFSIHTPVVTSIKTIEKPTVLLGQNIPNPFTRESTVNYNLAKDASSAVFTVTDVMGRIISSEKVATTIGNHSIKLGAYDAGLYYYSLNVDGHVSTKKMIVE